MLISRKTTSGRNRSDLASIMPIMKLKLIVCAMLMGLAIYFIFISMNSSNIVSHLPSMSYAWSQCFRKDVPELECPPDKNWIYEMHTWTNQKGPRSQGGQDLYLDKIFSVIRAKRKYFVEFGFNVPNYTVGNAQGSGANTQKLYESGWRGLLLDGTRENPEINLRKHFLYATNIAKIFADYQVPKDFDYLSCDLDSHDLWIFRAILEAGYRPRVITTEFNSNYPLTVPITLIDPTMENLPSNQAKPTFVFQNCSWGTSAAALRLVAETYNYTMVGRINLLDLVWVRNDLLVQECTAIPPFEWFFKDIAMGTLHYPAHTSPDVLTKLIDYETYVRTNGDITASNLAARNLLKKYNLTCYANIYNFL